MPMVTVHHVRGALDATQKEALAEEMTHVLLTIEGGEDTEAGRSLAWVRFQEVDNDDWYVGGTTGAKYVSAAGKFLVIVTVPEGSMEKTRKSQVHAAVNASILKITGTTDVPGAGRSAWVHVIEIPEGHWGTSGKTAGVMGIARIVGLAPQSPLLDYPRAYFDAKDRLYDAAGFPPDAAGRAVVRY